MSAAAGRVTMTTHSCFSYLLPHPTSTSLGIEPQNQMGGREHRSLRYQEPCCQPLVVWPGWTPQEGPQGGLPFSLLSSELLAIPDSQEGHLCFLEFPSSFFLKLLWKFVRHELSVIYVFSPSGVLRVKFRNLNHVLHPCRLSPCSSGSRDICLR